MIAFGKMVFKISSLRQLVVGCAAGLSQHDLWPPALIPANFTLQNKCLLILILWSGILFSICILPITPFPHCWTLPLLFLLLWEHHPGLKACCSCSRACMRLAKWPGCSTATPASAPSHWHSWWSGGCGYRCPHPSLLWHTPTPCPCLYPC